MVGIGRTELEVAGSQPLLLLTPAFYALHRDDIGHFDEILQVRLTHGDQDVAAFQAGVQRVVPESEGATVTPQADSSTSIEDATGVQAVSLLIFAIAAGLAGFVATGQALARQTALSTDDQIKLHALGLSRRQRFTALIAAGGARRRHGSRRGCWGGVAGLAGDADWPRSPGRATIPASPPIGSSSDSASWRSPSSCRAAPPYRRGALPAARATRPSRLARRGWWRGWRGSMHRRRL